MTDSPAAVAHSVDNDDNCSESSMSRSSLTSTSELRRTLDLLNLNKQPRTTREQHHLAPTAPYRPPPAVAWLVGTWKGRGKGIYPTIKDFDYMEETTFDWDSSNPRPLLLYRQQTYTLTGNPPKPMHAESGYVRVITPVGSSTKRIEFVISAPNGVSTVEEGVVEGHTIKVKLTATSRSSTARPPHCTGLERTFVVDPDAMPPTLHYTVDMATTKTPEMTRHLEAILTRWSDDVTSTDVTDSEQDDAKTGARKQERS